MPDPDAMVRSELLFREVNERIYDIGASDTEPLEVLCECGDDSCISTLAISVRDYRRVRGANSRFVVCEGHELADIERVVERTPQYLVVEKVGRARRMVDQGGSRSASLRSTSRASRQVVHRSPQ
jgi:hypothetical protein